MTDAHPAVRPPTAAAIEDIARRYRLDLSAEDVAGFLGLMAGPLASFDRIDQLTAPAAINRYPRTPGYRPQPEDNPLNAWYWKSEIPGAESGPLAGRTLAVKDNVCVAGVPMMNGTRVLEGYVPDADATVVTRVLDAGATILGKSVCESLCFSGASHTNDTGPVRNPHDPGRTSGGSSAGSGALVAAGEVDMAIGGDQGGSVRIPASWCGIYGLKPTWGLVPYTGAFPIEITLDHLGPMAATTADVALLLEVMAGPDGLDPRQSAQLAPAGYRKALIGDAEGLRIGIVSEGFGWEGASEADVDEAVRAAAGRFADLGASVTEVSVPWHRDGIHLFNGIAFEGATKLMVEGNSMGTNWKGEYNVGLLDAFARGRLTRADDLSETVKLVTLLGQYLQDRYHGRYYAKSRNLARSLEAAYDAALVDCDLLVMPTLPMKATPIPPGDAPREEVIGRALEMVPNTAPFDVTGHPAMSLPCAVADGLPIGMMLIGRKGEEATILRASDAFERNVFARPVPA
ncbi:amidase [Salinisphaera sp. P385]|uniref:Amidase n=1 Tax=Spectribacter acetivorans TaxID=3075603 RepID=A0ABU3BDS3_9GAMM|nr:amidase [Salinisphaera sp. P385]MDT0619603.1 amidase [Salinisphaera sp. P385]